MISEGYTKGIGQIWLDDVECNGSENNLVDCTANTGTHDCTHVEDAGISCPGIEQQLSCMASFCGCLCSSRMCFHLHGVGAQSCSPLHHSKLGPQST